MYYNIILLGGIWNVSMIKLSTEHPVCLIDSSDGIPLHIIYILIEYLCNPYPG